MLPSVKPTSRLPIANAFLCTCRETKNQTSVVRRRNLALMQLSRNITLTFLKIWFREQCVRFEICFEFEVQHRKRGDIDNNITSNLTSLSLCLFFHLIWFWTLTDKHPPDESAYCGCKQSCSEMDFGFSSSSIPIAADTLKQRFNNELRFFLKHQEQIL